MKFNKGIQLNKILEKVNFVSGMRELFGTSNDFDHKYKKALERIANAIYSEKNIPKSMIMTLPPDTELNSIEVIDAFIALCRLIEQKKPRGLE